MLAAYKTVTVVRTQKDVATERLTQVHSLELSTDESSGAQDACIFICPTSRPGHPFFGFGGSFTEASAVTLQKMSEDKQDEILRAYFDPTVGIGYTIGRLPMASCDFGLGNWTCGNLTDGDMQLEGFSIDHYGQAILPMVKRSMAMVSAPFSMLASPWSPPPWMKTKQQFHGDGHLKPECAAAWAYHFVRFIEEMQKTGVPIWGVSVQNEPEAAQVWESCIYTAVEERDFVRDHLGPALEKAGLGSVKILVWDHNRDGMLERAAVAYGDPEAEKYIWGVGYHWYGDARYESWPERSEVPFQDRQRDCAPITELRGRVGFDNVRLVADLRPEKHILFTEGCQELGGRPLKELLGEWKLGERYAMNMISDFNSGCEGWIDWNLWLDETGGPNHVGNLCSAPIICDTENNEVLYQPSYWYLGHFSRYISPGAQRLLASSSRDALEVVAFLNPDTSVAVVVMNQSDQDMQFWLKAPGGSARVDAPKRSISTFILRDS
eukprot:TRINITY_DN35292_c0_g1_i1.p1 TRINITY_DN35292_c0_g1~~TRINITY_DN35292_c0_g1_i1.p1  ORF type:complete len:493 (-),score=69.53 TRINITY_DN35292_c0_g1_i1:113-1591(-)